MPSRQMLQVGQPNHLASSSPISPNIPDSANLAIISEPMEIISKHKPFKNTGDDFANSNPMFAYYFYKYYISVIKPIYEQAKEASEKGELQAEIKQTSKKMSGVSAVCQVDPSDQVNAATILEYTELMFAKNDHYHQQGMFTKQIAEDYLTIYRLYEVAARFGKLDDGQNKRRVYSKKKFIDIMKEIKKNPALQNHKPSHLAQSGKPSDFTESGKPSELAQTGKPSEFAQPVKPAQQLPPPPFKEQKKIEKIEQEIKKSNFKPLPKASKLISFDRIQMQIEANRSLENALSELSFDRFKHARDEVIHVLELLDQLIDG